MAQQSPSTQEETHMNTVKTALLIGPEQFQGIGAQSWGKSGESHNFLLVVVVGGWGRSDMTTAYVKGEMQNMVL